MISDPGESQEQMWPFYIVPKVIFDIKSLNGYTTVDGPLLKDEGTIWFGIIDSLYSSPIFISTSTTSVA